MPTKRDMKVAALVAALAATLGIGFSRNVIGQSAPKTDVDSIRFFRADDPDAGSVIAYEGCGSATVKYDGGESIVEQGCVSDVLKNLGTATERSKCVDCLQAVKADWIEKKGVQP